MLLNLENLSVRFGHRLAVDNVNWSAGHGIHVLLGPNGAGKTTLLRTIATLNQPTTGTVEINGVTGQASKELLGYLPQENLTKSRFTVAEYLAYACWLRRIPHKEISSEVERLTALADLCDRSNARIRSLSGGMRRRVQIAAALAGSPPALLLDEPTAGLDVAQRTQFRHILSQVADTTCVVLSTHIVEDIVDVASTVTVMDQARFLYHESWENFGAGRTLQELNTRYLDIVATAGSTFPTR